VAAAFGGLAPVLGAVLQEAIDLAVILNALRARSSGRGAPQPSAQSVAAGVDVLTEHHALRAGTARIREVADELGRIPPGQARVALQEVRRFVDQQLLPHERAEEQVFYPAAAPYIGGQAVVQARRMHAEVAHLARLFGRMLDDLSAEGPTSEEQAGLRRVLYGLHAVLVLHRAAEEEDSVSVVVDTPPGEGDQRAATEAGAERGLVRASTAGGTSSMGTCTESTKAADTLS
jgi:iron-sulfur cluster repair protein YtfE (RIC family)